MIISVIGFYNSRQNFELEIWAKIANTTRNTDNHIPVIIYPNDHSLGYTYHVSKLPNYKGEFLDKVVIVPTPFPELNLNRPTMAGVPIVKKEDVSEVLTSIDHANEFWLVHDKREFLDPNFEFIIELNKHYELIEPHIWGGKYRKKH